MKVSMNHLRELVNTDINVLDLAALFNLHSSEVEDAYKLVDASNLVVGYVTDKQQHPDADKLSVCQVDLGGETTQIVCGAPNVDQGQYVIVSRPGAELPGGFKIKATTIRGVESNGMICSLAELGLDKKFVDASGIEIINVPCNAGDDPLAVLELTDEVMALDLTPNRADLLSVMGVAYDTAAILDLKVTLPEVNVTESTTPNPVKVVIDTDNCMSYYARVIENVEIKESPQWMKSRLIAMGVRPINNVVDITNYVMLETGQPLHAFDYDRLDSDTILVRMAQDGEKLVTLDEQQRTLTKDDIVITNGTKAVALGGVMGGFDTEIIPTTKRLLLESANFNPLNIRKTSARLDLRSESSMRFERKVDPKRTLLALERATALFQEYASGTVYKGIASVNNMDSLEPVVSTSTSQINDYLGSSLSDEAVMDILRRLDFQFEQQDGQLLVTLPSRRQDMETYQDIIEEVGRIMGYDSLPLTLPQTVSLGQLSPLQQFKREVKTRLTGLGLTEAITYGLVAEERALDFTAGNATLTKVLMPMSQDKSTLTMSPLVSMIDVLQYNKARKQHDIFLFELGKRYNAEETEVISGALMGTLRSNKWQGQTKPIDFYTVKGLLESLFDSLYLSHVEFVPMSDYENLHPGQSAYIRDYHGVIGFIGKLHPEYEKAHDLENVYVFELEVEPLFERRRVLKKFQDIAKYPEVERDIAIVVDNEVTAKDILDVVNKAGKRMLIHSEVFDVYRGESLTDNQKSIAVKLIFQDPKKTLEAKEVDTRVNEILGILKATLEAELR